MAGARSTALSTSSRRSPGALEHFSGALMAPGASKSHRLTILAARRPSSPARSSRATRVVDAESRRCAFAAASDTIAPVDLVSGHAPRVEDIERRAEDRGSAEFVGARRGGGRAARGVRHALRFLVVFAKGAVGASSQVALGAYLDHIEQLAAPQLAGLDGELALRLDIGWPARPRSAPRARPRRTSSTR